MVSDALDDSDGDRHTRCATCRGAAQGERTQRERCRLTRMLKMSRRPSARARALATAPPASTWLGSAKTGTAGKAGFATARPLGRPRRTTSTRSANATSSQRRRRCLGHQPRVPSRGHGARQCEDRRRWRRW
eukprot:11299721-Alexandrium_andersonii.AAC.1